ncbi:alanine--tRNA ligase [Candidatus Dojkabacteria bacterium]|nr:alanine--tRNA ligase [Candidatus Dojkabacteria bacterium]
MKTSKDIRNTYIDFWTSSPRDHNKIPNVSLVPNVDSTLLFVNSGMFPLAPYLSGEQKHPLGTRLCNFQRCLRTKYDEMLEIGDNRHTLMFEMMGNWSLGDYFKKEQIPWMLELYVERFGLDPRRIYVSVWAGDELVSRDDEAINAWVKAFKKYDVEAEFCEDLQNLPESVEDGKEHKARIFPYGKSDNWWQRGEAPGELGGPSSELFYDTGVIEREQDEYHINDDSGRFLEVGNSVFMQYKLDEDMQWQPLKQKNIDFGGGFERVVMCVQDKNDIFETDIYQPILDKVEEISGKKYKTEEKENEWTASFRVIADHARASAFILADGVLPSNKDQGYILRRFIRRLVRFGMKLDIEKNFTKEIAEKVIEHMEDVYPHLGKNSDVILEQIEKEEIKFRRTLKKGLKELEKIREETEEIDGNKAFYIYQTFGFPLELTLDELQVDEERAAKIEQDFRIAEQKHREKSRAGVDKKFKGGLADHSEIVTKYHTATHLLLESLRRVLGDHVHQKGSNITAERLRFDFSHNSKLNDDEVRKVEDMVNKVIEKDYKVFKKALPKNIASKLEAQMEFGRKYGDIVDVYFIVDPEAKYDKRNPNIEEIEEDKIFSKEFCGGPHVENTGKLGEEGMKFKIFKQKNIGSGLLRIKARLE